MNALLEVDHIDKVYGDVQILKDITFNINEGEIFGLLGPNGAGKTTLIRILNQITAPDHGKILYRGQMLNRSQISEFGYLPEERGLYRKMKVWEQAVYLTRIKGLSKRDAERELKTWFEKLNMTSWINRRVEELSKGMQQRLQFAITVAHKPKVLILDEPFSGFDPVNARELKEHIQTLGEEGTTIIFSTHNMQSVEDLCEHICLINKGENILSGSVDDIRGNYRKSLYEVTFSGSRVAFANALGFQAEIVTLTEHQDSIDATIKAMDGISPNQLLSNLITGIEILSFKEVLPSLNDIFIDKVTSPDHEITADNVE